MTNGISPVPEGFHTVTPYLMVPDADALVEFMGRAFAAEETFRARGAHGGLHVEVRVGDSMVMIGGHEDTEPRPAAIFLYVDGVDEVYRRALAAGATPIEEPADRPEDGDRRAGVADPFGNAWFIATCIEDVSRAELQKRHDNTA
jgi:PhnB protein